MAIRCPDCKKFASINDEAEVSVELNDFDQDDGTIEGEVRLVNECADCGQELTEAHFDVLLDFKQLLASHDCPEKETGEGWTAEVGEPERFTREHPPKAKVRKKFYGVRVPVTVTCNCKKQVTETLEFEDEVQASAMDALV